MYLEVISIEVPISVMDLSKTLEGPIERNHDRATESMMALYRNYIMLEGGVKSGELLASVHIEVGDSTGDERTNFVVASARHSRVFEYGWTEKAQGQLSYPGRFPAQQAADFFISALQGGVPIFGPLDWSSDEV